jgi:cyanophycinase-like exopeptidase
MKSIALLFVLFTLTLRCFGFNCIDTIKGDKHIPGRPASIGIIGDTANVNTPVKGGVAMIGGGKDVDNAFKWLISRSGGGDVVVIRASGTDAYDPYIFNLDKINSVETLKIDTRALANNDTIANIVRNAEMLFIAGGDQSNYMRYWRGTKVLEAINYLLNVKHAPVGGTSAGCAILGGFYYSGEDGSITADEALVNPYNPLVKVYNNDFLQTPYLKNIITDQHYVTRNRQGRHVTFLSRIIKNWNIYANGIAADERTAVCMDDKGKATIIGTGKAFFLFTDHKKAPESCEPDKPLVWNGQHQAIKVYEIQGTPDGNGHFDIAHFNPDKAQGGIWYWWWVDNGKLNQQLIQ